jgi:hypothetical protein
MKLGRIEADRIGSYHSQHGIEIELSLLMEWLLT